MINNSIKIELNGKPKILFKLRKEIIEYIR